MFRGGQGFAADVDAGSNSALIRVWGALPNDRIRLIGLSDVNADEVQELVIAGRTFSADQLPVVWLVSPVDLDGDGFMQLADNCPIVANPNQTDADQDGVGDACQFDYDADGLGDAIDCLPSRASAGTPPAVVSVRFAIGSTTQLGWNPAPFAELYDLQRGLLSDLSNTNLGSCINTLDTDRADTSFNDVAVPPVGNGFYYLVRGVDTECPSSGSWGTNSSGAERSNQNLARCP